MGEAHGRAGQAGGWLFEPTFNRSIKLRHADPRITSDAGALLLREADHRLGLTADLAARLTEPRHALGRTAIAAAQDRVHEALAQTRRGIAD